MREYVWTTVKALYVVAVLAVLAGIGASLLPNEPDTGSGPVTLTTDATAVSGDARPVGDTVRLADDPAVAAGVCRTYGDHVRCAPLYGPDGAALAGRVGETGSAQYGTGPDAWTLDPESARFYRERIEYYSPSN